MKNTKIEIRNLKFANRSFGLQAQNQFQISNFEFQKKKGFSLVELIIVIMIIGILTVVSYIAIERSRSKAMNDKMLDDLVAIANALEDYKRDHQLFYPIPEPDTEDLINQNVLCYYADATYAHSCDPADGAVFVQGMIDNNLLSKRYLRDVPTDPRTGSRYVYGVTNNRKYFQVAGIYEREDGTYEARTVENLIKGFELPSIIRAYDSANFVIDKETYLPYSPDHLILTATIQNINGTVAVNQETNFVEDGYILHSGEIVITPNDHISSADIYFSDGSITHIDPGSTLKMDNLEVAKNDKEGTVTKILLQLNVGKIWSKVARLAQNSSFDVKTTGAIAGVRGTEYGVEVDPDNKMLKEVTVLSGDVKVSEVTPEGTAGNTIVDIYGVTPDSPQIAPFTNGVPGTVTTANKLEIFKDYYKYIPLNSGIRPHIISAKYENGSGKLVIRNVNFFANIVNAKFGLSGDSAHRVQANTLAIYDLNDLNNPIIPPTVLPNTEPQILPYEIEIPPDASGKSLVARFEYWKDNKLIRASRISMPPIKMEDGTDLTEEQLYPNLFQAEQPTLTIDAPPYFALKKGAGDQWISADIEPPLKAVIMPKATSNYTPTVTPSGVCTAAPTGSLSDTGFDINVRASEPGDCNISVTVSFADGKELSAESVIKIVSETDKLILLSPPDGAEILKTQQNQTINFSWLAPGASTGPFSLIIGSGNPISLITTTYAYALPAGTIGEVQWKVQLPDVGAEQTARFTIKEPVDAGFDITSTDAAHTIRWNGIQGSIVIPQPAPDEIGLNVNYTNPDASSYNLEWAFNNKINPPSNFTLPFNASIKTANMSGTVFASITLNLRDKNSGNVVGWSTKTITVTNYPVLTGIGFRTSSVDMPANSYSYTIPDNDIYINEPLNSGFVPLSKCDPLSASASLNAYITDNTVTFNPLLCLSGTCSLNVTCTLNPGTTLPNIINGFIVTSQITSSPLEINVTGSTTCNNDGVKEGIEECDDGNSNNNDACDIDCHNTGILFFADYLDGQISPDYPASGVQCSDVNASAISGSGLQITSGDGNYFSCPAISTFNPNEGSMEIVIDNRDLGNGNPLNTNRAIYVFDSLDTTSTLLTGVTNQLDCVTSPNNGIWLGTSCHKKNMNRVDIYKDSNNKLFFESFAGGPSDALKASYVSGGVPQALPSTILNAPYVKIIIKWDTNIIDSTSRLVALDLGGNEIANEPLSKFGTNKSTTSFIPASFHLGSQAGGSINILTVSSTDCSTAGSCKTACQNKNGSWSGDQASMSPASGTCFTYTQYPGFIKSVKITQ